MIKEVSFPDYLLKLKNVSGSVHLLIESESFATAVVYDFFETRPEIQPTLLMIQKDDTDRS